MPNEERKQIREDEEIKIVPKGWGEERWIHNDELYCGKLLVLKQGKHCSLHYHVLKTETFYVAKGRLSLELTSLEQAEKEPPEINEVFELGEGEAIVLRPGMVHRFTGLAEETHIFEFSTEHFDEDSKRIVKGV
ncbi:cupin domain-containing protein [bacterium]|nr:cupin domain-containing protein [bacterium]